MVTFKPRLWLFQTLRNRKQPIALINSKLSLFRRARRNRGD